MAETFLSILLLMFISSRYFVHNARRDTESDTVIQTSPYHKPVSAVTSKMGGIPVSEESSPFGRHKI